MTHAQVAVTGGSGFIGAAVLASLSARRVGTTVLARRPDAVAGDGASHAVAGDLLDPGALAATCSGARVLIHAASYVGSDERLQREVNVDGTRLLVDAARQAGVDRIVYLSTAGVYGGDLGPGLSEDEADPAPRSPLSASRREAEGFVLAEGGIVVRPHLVHGAGDRWFLSQVLAAMQHLGAWFGDQQARISTIGRTRLGELITALAVGDAPPGVYHAAERDPVLVRDLIDPVYTRAGKPTPEQTISADEAADRLRPAGITRRQIDLVGRDSWFRSEKIWDATAQLYRSEVTIDVPEDVEWYAASMRPVVTGTAAIELHVAHDRAGQPGYSASAANVCAVGAMPQSTK